MQLPPNDVVMYVSNSINDLKTCISRTHRHYVFSLNLKIENEALLYAAKDQALYLQNAIKFKMLNYPQGPPCRLCSRHFFHLLSACPMLATCNTDL